MAALRAAPDLLAAEDQVIGVGVLRLVFVRHGVEGPHGRRVAVQEEQVYAVLLLHQRSQRALLLSAQVGHLVPLHALLLEHRVALLPVDDAGLLRDRGRSRRVHFPDHLELLLAVRLQAAADVVQRLVHHLEHLVVVPVDGHLKVEPRELAQVPGRVRVLRPKDGANLEDAGQVRRDRHLLVDLWRLRQRRHLAKVVRTEDLSATLALAGDELRRVDLHKAALRQRVAEEAADGPLNTQDGVVRRHAEVEPPVVQPKVGQHADVRPVRAQGLLDLGLTAGGVR
mmetsp:Transcript_28828/g.73073  ORF Transcript_28828/g.73073 Transcript_28828/m.73073 type:complete len:283 (-) Transcript_28828:866-1714(-)